MITFFIFTDLYIIQTPPPPSPNGKCLNFFQVCYSFPKPKCLVYHMIREREGKGEQRLLDWIGLVFTVRDFDHSMSHTTAFKQSQPMLCVVSQTDGFVDLKDQGLG